MPYRMGPIVRLEFSRSAPRRSGGVVRSGQGVGSPASSRTSSPGCRNAASAAEQFYFAARRNHRAIHVPIQVLPTGRWSRNPATAHVGRTVLACRQGASHPGLKSALASVEKVIGALACRAWYCTDDTACPHQGLTANRVFAEHRSA
jgi:hypothetical protein